MTDHTVRLVVPEPQLVIVDADRAGLPAVLVLNEALLSFAHFALFPWHLRVVLEAADLAEHGMPTSDESRLLFSIGDHIEAAVVGCQTETGGKNALFLARVTWNAERELHFQVHNPEIANQLLQRIVESEHWERHWRYEMRFDEDWSAAAPFFQLLASAHGVDA